MVIPESYVVILISCLATAFLLTLIGLFYITTLRDRSRSTYDRANNHAQLSAMREAYEAQIAKLNVQLQSTPQRWADVNHLIVEGQNSQPDYIDSKPKVAFLDALGVDPSAIDVDPKLVVVLTPFSEDEYETYQVVKHVCHEAGLRCARGDEEFHTGGDILRHVVRLILSARVVVANISSRNANVFYELGIAHALGKPTILFSRTIDDVPFDVAGKRIIVFRDKDDLAKKLNSSMVRALVE